MKLVIVAAVLLAGTGIVACGGDDAGDPAGAPVIEVKLRNWAVEPAVASAPSGKVTFRAVHEKEEHGHGDGGGLVHELAVSKKNADGSADLIATTGELGVGEQKDLTLTLEPGEYELQCNLVETVGGKAVGHYPQGMHTAFKVT